MPSRSKRAPLPAPAPKKPRKPANPAGRRTPRPLHAMHAHVMSRYSRNYHMRYCAIPVCGYCERWDAAKRRYVAVTVAGDPPIKRLPRVVSVSLWSGMEVSPL